MSFVRAVAPLWMVLVLLLGTTGSARAQANRPGAVAAAAAAVSTPAPEVEAADSPRASMRAFIDLCDHGRYEEAAHYLDVPKGAEKRTAELASKLQEVLDQRLWVDADHLSPLSLGNKDDALPAGTEELGRIVDSKGHQVPIRIVRHEAKSPEDEPRWLFSQATVIAIDSLHASLKARWVREHFPPVLLLEGPKSLYYWQWNRAAPARRGMSRGRARARGALELGRAFVSRRGGRGRCGSSSASFAPRRWHGRSPRSGCSCPTSGSRCARKTSSFACCVRWGGSRFFWALLRSVSVAGDEIAEADWAAERHNIRSITGVGVRLGKVVVAALALMVALSQLGYPVTTVVAGLGIGGVALALAAQKTVENLFGSVSILADQPFGVGDTIRVDSIEGAVESIGLRSTRIRTVERTLIIIPNGKLADMRIESLGPRDRIRFATKLSVSRDATVAQLETIIEAVHAKLVAHSAVYQNDVQVRLGGLGESSFDIDVAAPIETTNANEFAKIREELLFACVRVVSDAGATLALPARRIVGPKEQG